LGLDESVGELLCGLVDPLLLLFVHHELLSSGFLGSFAHIT
jgi:hypothetical protein